MSTKRQARENANPAAFKLSECHFEYISDPDNLQKRTLFITPPDDQITELSTWLNQHFIDHQAGARGPARIYDGEALDAIKAILHDNKIDVPGFTDVIPTIIRFDPAHYTYAPHFSESDGVTKLRVHAHDNTFPTLVTLQDELHAGKEKPVGDITLVPGQIPYIELADSASNRRLLSNLKVRLHDPEMPDAITTPLHVKYPQHVQAR